MTSFKNRVRRPSRFFGAFRRGIHSLHVWLLIPLTVMLLGSKCSNTNTQPPNREPQLIGEWAGVAALITIQSEGGSPQSRTISVSEDEWESKMNRTMPKMTYFADHRYRSWYVSHIDAEGRQVNDTMRQEGTWTLKGDSLFIREPKLSVPESAFKLAFKDNQVELESKMDIDGDGAQDDAYWMLQRRMK